MVNLPLFPDNVVDAPATEGIKYAGSKRKLLPHILELAKNTGARSVLDGFAGSTRVSQALAQTGYKVFANDIAIWSETFAKCYLLNTHPPAHYKPIIDHLNHLPPRDGWFTEHYGGAAALTSNQTSKRPWQIHNTRKLDAIREEIDRLSITPIERAVLLTSLILALDSVDSTLGHYVSYLSDWSPRSFKTMRLEVPRLFSSEEAHTVRRGDIFDVCAQDADLAYFDPPYGSNNDKMPPSRVRYAAYYHLWTTICLNDRPPLFGRANRRADTSDTVTNCVFEEFRKAPNGRFVAVEAIDTLLRSTRAPFIILSYSSGGRATAAQLDEVIRNVGKIVEARQLVHTRNVMSGMRWTHEWTREAKDPHREFLFLIARN